MNKNQIEEIIKAILARQYSWACVLMLRYNGYDPLNYIPYRTYIRLLKKNYQIDQENLKNDTGNERVEFLNLNSSNIHIVKQDKTQKGENASHSIPVKQYQRAK